MNDGSVIVNSSQFALTIERLCYQLIENHGDFQNSCIIGIQPRGTLLANRIVSVLKRISNINDLLYGKLDITFYRDDYRARTKPLSASVTEMDFIIEGKKVILIDDVLYTGRTISAALNSLLHYGRPNMVELLVLVDRRFNRELPVQSNYTGITIDALAQEYVKVEWVEEHGIDQILFYSGKS